ncbi:copper homeostasis periplasmic binding protein CopC [Pseudomonas helleri]|uniref:Copper resistance protein C n=1 Tax=Pseudomonas helleri TaxID=1608996 RepID=A0A7X2CII1_9PSED|nr:copper homeostasis periplasmic binding protein CopC [Pseudomonas helleri]MQT74979.1 copper homeostasis periplasmic binding protein CopC [Pseudomonas helleri]MQT97286.1 copper homeostasis periplasmic binding protein CopC [Pseudomonas helleri]MQU32687.1 copper homeostasis periplasmic binding protein CopC [Pseudomonas helleri]
MSAAFLKKILNASALVALMAGASTAFAHAHLEQATPAADSSASDVKVLRLQFSEGVEQAFSKVAVSHDGAPVALSSVKTEPADQKVLIVTPEQPLASGQYEVKWNAVSVDTHKSNGEYSFTVSN